MNSTKIFLTIFAMALFATIQMEAQSHQHGSHSMKDMKEMKMDTAKAEDIVREGTIDLKAIDKNKDGKVFQDQMDWNVISDTPGKCPLCKMVLKEVTVIQAKANLTKAGFMTR